MTIFVSVPLALTVALTGMPENIGAPLLVAQQNAEVYLVEGSQGAAVRSLQQRLQALGYYRGQISGIFDAATKEAVIRFQRAQGLAPDGVVGSRTLTLLGQARPPAPAPTPVALLAVGSQGTRVRSLQQRLRSLGYYRGEVSGSFDAATKEALIRFQRDRNLPADGIAGEQTFAALGSAATTPTANPPALAQIDSAAISPERVRELQARLQQLGFYQGAIDGLWGPATQAAVEKAQQSYGVNRSDIGR